MNHENEISERDLFKELQKYEQNGVSIWFEGSPSSADEVSEIMCVHENTTYMRDYVFKEGRLSELRFDKITKQ